MKTFSLFILAAAVVTSSACSRDGSPIGPPTPPSDVTAPTIWSTVPADYSTSISTHGALTITFSEPMDPATLTNLSFTLMQQNTPVPARVSFDGVTATLVPTDSLLANANFTASVSVVATDVAGNALATSSSWYFRTR
jgi:hypothetical protein